MNDRPAEKSAYNTEKEAFDLKILSDDDSGKYGKSHSYQCCRNLSWYIFALWKKSEKYHADKLNYAEENENRDW